nr:YihY/virulence factor BrkB family protein [Clostridia bacterium]
MLNKIITTFRYYSDKRFSTIAGTLVYFLLMSIAPFLLWLTLVFGDVHIEEFLNHNFLESVSPFLKYLKDSAESAASGAGIVLLITSLYSSTNFFYHLRRSGEIIYDSARVKGGLKIRIASLFLIIAAIILVASIGG